MVPGGIASLAMVGVRLVMTDDQEHDGKRLKLLKNHDASMRRN
jgi:hypothetical protein